MKLISTLFPALAFLTLAGSAQDQPVPELETLKKEYAVLVTDTDRPHLVAVAELDKKYVARLAREQEAAQQAGKLEEALAFEGEKKAILPDVPLQENPNTPLALRKMRATYSAEIAKLNLARVTDLKPLRDDYVKELQALMKSLTKGGRLNEAVTVKRFLEDFIRRDPDPPSHPPAPNPQAGTVMSIKFPGGAVMKFCYCPPGSFKMGSPPSEKGRGQDEDQVNVRLSKGFWMAQTECTQAQWVALMGGNPSGFKGDDLPVETVNWDDVHRFITKLNDAKTLPAGWKVALPTEAQWEYACRAGTKTAFSFGESLNAKQANFDNTLAKTSTVASYPANAWGLYDMHGNVWEWCEDFYGDKLVGGTDPSGVPSGSGRVYRGGPWYDVGEYCRSAYRGRDAPDFRSNRLGFRLVAVPVGP